MRWLLRPARQWDGSATRLHGTHGRLARQICMNDKPGSKLIRGKHESCVSSSSPASNCFTPTSHSSQSSLAATLAAARRRPRNADLPRMAAFVPDDRFTGMRGRDPERPAPCTLTPRQFSFVARACAPERPELPASTQRHEDSPSPVVPAIEPDQP